MGKARTDKYGNTKEQRLVRENEKLKRQIGGLRKQIARLDLDRYDIVREMLEEHRQEDRAEQGKHVLESLKKTWACHKCEDGVMEIFIYTRTQEMYYYRICDNAPACMNRTKAQPYSQTVKGIIRKDRHSQSE
jgi:hypothetical protein